MQTHCLLWNSALPTKSLLIILTLPPFLSQNSNLTQVADTVAQLTESTDDLDANDVGIIAGFVEEIAIEATKNEEVRTKIYSIWTILRRV